jgi:hypothetical protein
LFRWNNKVWIKIIKKIEKRIYFFLVPPQDQAKLRMTINHLEEQIQLLKIKIEDINERLNNITSILQDIHLENVNFAETTFKKPKNLSS